MTLLYPKRAFPFWYKLAALAAVLVLLLFFTPLRHWTLSAVSYFSGAVFSPREIIVDENFSDALAEQIKFQQEEIRRLRRLLELKAVGTKAPVSAKIILGGGYLFSDTLVIDRGADAGINVGDLAVFEEFLAVGLVFETGGNWAKIVPFSRLGEVGVFRSGPGKETAFEAEGRGGGIMASELPATLDIKTGDPLWWGGAPEYLAGMVESVRRPAGSQLQSITIQSPVPYGSMVNLHILPL